MAKKLGTWIPIILVIVGMAVTAALWASDRHSELAAQNFATGAQAAVIAVEVQKNTEAIKSMEEKLDKLIHLILTSKPSKGGAIEISNL